MTQLVIRLQCRRPGFDTWVGKIPWRRERLPIPVFQLGEFYGLYSPWGRKEPDTAEQLPLCTFVDVDIDKDTDIERGREVIFKGLIHTIMEAGKSKVGCVGQQIGDQCEDPTNVSVEVQRLSPGRIPSPSGEVNLLV